MLNAMLSRTIYAELNAGHVINAHLYNAGAEKNNPLYLELSTEREDYARLYDALGYELVHRPGFFFIREAATDDPYREATVKVVALLTIIGRGIMQQGYRFSLLVNEGSGVSEEIAQALDSAEEYRDIMQAVGLKNGLWQEMKNNLVERRIAYINDAGRLVLADSGRHFFDTLFLDSGVAVPNQEITIEP
jgi:hypothetical protein